MEISKTVLRNFSKNLKLQKKSTEIFSKKVKILKNMPTNIAKLKVSKKILKNLSKNRKFQNIVLRIKKNGSFKNCTVTCF